MRRTTIMLSLSLIFTSSVFAVGVPTDYIDLDNSKKTGLKSYKSKNEKFYVINAPLRKFSLDFGAVGEENHDLTSPWGHRYFEKNNIEEYYNPIMKPYAILNGQFFGEHADDDSVGAFSYALKGGGKVFQDENEQTFEKRTLYMVQLDKGGVSYPLMIRGYRKNILNHNIVTNAITGLDPYFDNTKDENCAEKNKKSLCTIKEKIKHSEKIGRNYIGCIPFSKYKNNKKVAFCKNLIFFHANSATHNEVLTEMEKWGIKKYHSMIMDGSGSSQLYSKKMSSSGNIELSGKNSLGWADERVLPMLFQFLKDRR
jgi:hypothetical protein